MGTEFRAMDAKMQDTHASFDTRAPLLRRFMDPSMRWARRATIALLALNALLIVYFVCFGYESYFHSDAAVKNLLAGEILETGHFFPPDWNYVNGDLWIVFGHVFILPLLLFFKNGYALHAASGLATSALILAAAWAVSGVASRSPLTRLVFVVIVASGISGVVAEELYGQVSYGSIFCIACFNVYFSWRFLQAEGRGRWTWGSALAIAMVLVFWSNPQRAVASYMLPIVVATMVYSGVSLGRTGLHWNARATRGAAMLALLLLGSAIGSVLHAWILEGVNNAPGAGYARWLTFDGVIKNAGYTIEGLLSVLGGVPTAARPVMSMAGLYEGVRLLGGCVVLLLTPAILWRSLRDRNDGVRFMGVFTLVSASLFVFLHVTTTIPDMTDPVTTSRYLVPAVLFCLLLLVVSVMDSRGNLLPRLLGGGALLVLMTSAISPNNPLSLGLTGRHHDPRTQLIALLESNGLEYGYASFWNAGALSVLSDGEVKVRQVTIEQGIPMPMRHLSSDRWYRPSAWSGKTFLLLKDAEAAAMNWDLLASYAGQPVQKLRFDDFGIYVFPRNLAEVLPNWNVDLSGPLAIPLSATSPRTVGRYVAAGTHAAIVAGKGESGYVHFGPYMRLPPGRYRATFDVEAIGAGRASFGVVDVTSQQSAKVHASNGIAKAGKQRLELQFTLDRTVTDLEMRVFASGEGELKLLGISLSADK